MSEQANVRLILDIYDAFNRGDIAAVLNALDPQASLHFEGPAVIPWAGDWHGREGWTKFFQTIAANTSDISVKMEPFAAQGDNVVAAGRYQAGLKGTGKRIDSPLVHLWSVRDGKVLKCVELANTAAEVEALTASAAAGR